VQRWHATAIAAIALLISFLPTRAQAQDAGIPCDAFYRNADGSWTATGSTFIPGPDMITRPGGVFRPGVKIRGYDVAASLDKACPNPATAPPPPAAERTQQTGVPLSRFADANGNFDVARLTCGDLADAPAEEAALLVAWYSGPYDEAAKRRIINLPRLRTTIRGVIAYCKSNRGQNLVNAMDLLLR